MITPFNTKGFTAKPARLSAAIQAVPRKTRYENYDFDARSLYVKMQNSWRSNKVIQRSIRPHICGCSQGSRPLLWWNTWEHQKLSRSNVIDHDYDRWRLDRFRKFCTKTSTPTTILGLYPGHHRGIPISIVVWTVPSCAICRCFGDTELHRKTQGTPRKEKYLINV